MRRARRTAERAYNDAVIGGALSDEQLARRMAEVAEGGGGEVAGTSEPRRQQAKRKMGVR